MNNNLEKLFANLKSPEPPEKLFPNIISLIHKEQKLSVIRTRFVIFSITFIGSIIALLPVIQTLKTSLSESGFMNFSSLILSDLEVVINNWQDYSITLLESLPVINIVILLIVLFVLLKSIQYMALNFKKFLHTAFNH